MMKINCLWLPDQMTEKFCLTCSFCFVFNCFVCFKLMEKYFNLINGISCFYRLIVVISSVLKLSTVLMSTNDWKYHWLYVNTPFRFYLPGNGTPISRPSFNSESNAAPHLSNNYCVFIGQSDSFDEGESIDTGLSSDESWWRRQR